MKLIIAVVQNEDADAVVDALLENDFRATRLASTGGFLRRGNTTVMIGVQDQQVDHVMDLIRQEAPAARNSRTPAKCRQPPPPSSCSTSRNTSDSSRRCPPRPVSTQVIGAARLPERLHLHPSLAGVPIRVGWRWLIVAAAVTAITAHELAPELREISDALAWYGRVSVVIVGVIVSLGLHELAHVLVARRTSGRMLAIEPAMFGALSDTSFAPSDPPAEAQVAVAGPLASLLLAALFGGGAWATAGRFDAAYNVCLFLALANGALALVNLIPGYPLDGGRLLRALVWYLSDDLWSALVWRPSTARSCSSWACSAAS